MSTLKTPWPSVNREAKGVGSEFTHEKTLQASKPEMQSSSYSRIRAIWFYFSVEGQTKTPDFKNRSQERTDLCIFWDRHISNAFYPSCYRHYLTRVQGWGPPLPRYLWVMPQVQQFEGQWELTLANFIISHGRGWSQVLPWWTVLYAGCHHSLAGLGAGELRLFCCCVAALEHLLRMGDGAHDELRGWSSHMIFHPVHSVSKAEQPWSAMNKYLKFLGFL